MDSYPLTRENILLFTGDPAHSDSAIELADCPICSTIPESSHLLDIPSREVSYGGYPDAFAQLEELIQVSHALTLLRCPTCSRLYSDESHYEYLAGGSEDEYILTRLSRAQAVALLEGLSANRIERKWDNKWVVEW